MVEPTVSAFEGGLVITPLLAVFSFVGVYGGFGFFFVAGIPSTLVLVLLCPIFARHYSYLCGGKGTALLKTSVLKQILVAHVCF